MSISNNYISFLPGEILFQICTHLNSSELVQLSKTSKFFCQFTQDEGLWKPIAESLGIRRPACIDIESWDSRKELSIYHRIYKNGSISGLNLLVSKLVGPSRYQQLATTEDLSIEDAADFEQFPIKTSYVYAQNNGIQVKMQGIKFRWIDRSQPEPSYALGIIYEMTLKKHLFFNSLISKPLFATGPLTDEQKQYVFRLIMGDACGRIDPATGKETEPKLIAGKSVVEII